MLTESAARDEELSIESEFATTIKYIDLSLRQKTDLFLQNYVFEPFEFLAKNLMYLSVIVPLLAAGTIIVVAGVILVIATVVPLWAALLITGASIIIMGGIVAYLLFSNTIILQTPTVMEMMKRGKA
ncbi:MAG: hypothetical protein EHM53_09705 [Methanoregulaceae archaeon]|nr:MAG: hypothetical protein EHM53_09705 [Methanoregulaceae archaeon]